MIKLHTLGALGGSGIVLPGDYLLVEGEGKEEQKEKNVRHRACSVLAGRVERGGR